MQYGSSIQLLRFTVVKQNDFDRLEEVRVVSLKVAAEYTPPMADNHLPRFRTVADDPSEFSRWLCVLLCR